MATSEREVLEIGGERYVVEEGAKGEFVVPASTPDHLEVQKPTSKDVRPGQVPEYSSSWRRGQGVSPGNRFTRCTNTPCLKACLAGRKYCSDKCMFQWANLRRNRRRRGVKEYVTIHQGFPVHFERKFPSNLTIAKKLFVEHIGEGVCQFRGENSHCLSLNNPYAHLDKPRCLLYSVKADDLLIWQGRVKGQVVERRYTTEDGRWQEGSPDDKYSSAYSGTGGSPSGGAEPS